MLADNTQTLADAAVLESKIPGALLESRADRGEVTFVIAPDHIAEVCSLLRRERGYRRLSCVTAVDWFPGEPRFEVVYHLHNLDGNRRLRLKCRLGGDPAEIDSVTPVWQSADWYEREVFDLFGIIFRGHPDLRRILLPEDWEGYPLRKDYPVHGFKYGYEGQ